MNTLRDRIHPLCVDKEALADISLKYRMNFLTPNCILSMENL
jgi:hypothetical protein